MVGCPTCSARAGCRQKRAEVRSECPKHGDYGMLVRVLFSRENIVDYSQFERNLAKKVYGGSSAEQRTARQNAATSRAY